MRYTTAADGVRIAFAVAGSGAPLVRVPGTPFSHCQREWQNSDFFDRLADGRMVIPFDPRGTGLSDRNVADHSLKARVTDIEAVVGALGLERFALHGIGSSGAPAIAYAVRHPDRVTHLVLDDTFIRGRDFTQSPQARALTQMSEDWEAMTEQLAFMSFGVGREEAKRYAEFFRACVERDEARRIMEAITTVDVSDLLPTVRVPTLIVEHRGTLHGATESARTLAAQIPGARLALLGGSAGDDLDRLLAALADFLGDRATAPRLAPQATAASAGGLRTILFTDVQAHTAIMQRLGDAAGRAVLREHEQIARAVLRQHGGVEVKAMGDGFMATFGSVISAVQCAIELQRAFHARNASATEPVLIRVGLNAGEPIAEDGDYFGSTVIMAARIAGQASGGEIFASLAVRELCAGKGIAFSERGDVLLRGFEDPIRLYEVSWRESP